MTLFAESSSVYRETTGPLAISEGFSWGLHSTHSPHSQQTIDLFFLLRPEAITGR